MLRLPVYGNLKVNKNMRNVRNGGNSLGGTNYLIEWWCWWLSVGGSIIIHLKVFGRERERES